MVTGSGEIVTQVAGRPPGLVSVQHSVLLPVVWVRLRARMLIAVWLGSQLVPLVVKLNVTHPLPLVPVQGFWNRLGGVPGSSPLAAQPLAIPPLRGFGLVVRKSTAKATLPKFDRFQPLLSGGQVIPARTGRGDTERTSVHPEAGRQVVEPDAVDDAATEAARGLAVGTPRFWEDSRPAW
jgi:hypothetical protein